MRPRIRRAFAGLLAPLVLLGLIAACGTESGPTEGGTATATADGHEADEKTSSVSDEDHEPPPAPPRRVIGQKGSKCRLPVKFAIPSKWKPRTIHPEGFDLELAGFRPVCEVDAKPAGNLGVMRAWLPQETEAPPPSPAPSGPSNAPSPAPAPSPSEVAPEPATTVPSDPRQALESFLLAGAGKVERPRYRPLEASASDGDTVAGVQATYVRFLPAIDERRKEAAFALSTAQGVLIVNLTGLDTEEYEEMLPAYVLVKTSIAVTRRAGS